MSAGRSTSLMLLAALGACGPSGPGDVAFDLTTPNQDDGAIQFTIRAPEPQTLGTVTAACAECQVFVETVSGAEVRGVVVGPVGAGRLLLVSVSDRGTHDYTATIQAAASLTYQLRDISQYTLRLDR